MAGQDRNLALFRKMAFGDKARQSRLQELVGGQVLGDVVGHHTVGKRQLAHGTHVVALGENRAFTAIGRQAEDGLSRDED